MSAARSRWGRTAAVGTVGFVVAVLLAGGARGQALYAYVLFLAALGSLLAVRRLDGAAATSPPLRASFRRGRPTVQPIPQLDALSRRLSSGQASSFDLHHRLRPLIREIAAARLAREHGVDLDARPDEARALVGARVWELVRPEREAPEQRFARGLDRRELEALVAELEAI